MPQGPRSPPSQLYGLSGGSGPRPLVEAPIWQLGYCCEMAAVLCNIQAPARRDLLEDWSVASDDEALLCIGASRGARQYGRNVFVNK